MASGPQETRYSIPIPRDLDLAVRERMRAGGFNSVSEYVRAAIRADLEHAKQAALEEKLLRAVERGKFTDAGPEFWNGLKALAATGKKRKPR
jgi:Arc/MetJ-type ribon-helix-helix transcriptional regulator